ncbi:MAG: hypothetical protein ACLGSD_10195 [Acidobacteriota bacterium]
MKTLVWDVDDVLNDLMRAWFENAWLPNHPDCQLRYEHLSVNPPDGILGIERQTYLASIDAFRATAKGEALAPDPELLRWFADQGAYFRHVALTARPLESAPAVAAWVMRHFGCWIRTVAVVPSRPPQSAPAYDLSKGDYLRWLGRGDALIDDTPDNLAQAANLGLRTFAWPQPWNQAKETKTTTLSRILELVEK